MGNQKLGRGDRLALSREERQKSGSFYAPLGAIAR